LKQILEMQKDKIAELEARLLIRRSESSVADTERERLENDIQENNSQERETQERDNREREREKENQALTLSLSELQTILLSAEEKRNGDISRIQVRVRVRVRVTNSIFELG
jgi:hypothetical protein